jgi:hypothetical protein
MLLISHKTQNLDLIPDTYDLLCEIDTFISNEAKTKLDSDRFGTRKCKVNMEDVQLLVKYQQILLDKIQNSCCLGDYSLDDIIHRIKQLLNRN